MLKRAWISISYTTSSSLTNSQLIWWLILKNADTRRFGLECSWWSTEAIFPRCWHERLALSIMLKSMEPSEFAAVLSKETPPVGASIALTICLGSAFSMRCTPPIQQATAFTSMCSTRYALAILTDGMTSYQFNSSINYYRNQIECSQAISTFSHWSRAVFRTRAIRWV